jgi:predicted Zn-dependent peptidase
VQAQAERDWLEQLATCGGRADEISHHALLFGDANRINTRIDEFRAVTADQVQAAASKWVRAGSRAQVTYRRQKDTAVAGTEAGEQE